MIRLTPALKAHAVKELGVAANASDVKFRSVISSAILKGKMTAKKLNELSPAKTAPKTPPATPPNPDPTKTGAAGITVTQEQLDALITKQVGSAMAQFDRGATAGADSLTPAKLFAAGADVRVKSACEHYSASTKSAFYPVKTLAGTPHALAGRPAMVAGHALNESSELEKAVAGAYFKWCLASGGKPLSEIPYALRMTDHDRDLMGHALRNMKWTGLIGGRGDNDGGEKVNRKSLTEMQVKALLDDNVSGGIEAAPIAFDDAIVLIPVLYGELFPYVKVINVARGRRMKGAAMQNPTFTSGTPEGTAIVPFSTAGFVSAFDTTIYPAVGALELGMDFEEDSPVAFGNQIVEQYGLKALEWLDRVVAVGNGTTEPLGIFGTPGAQVVNSDNGVAGPLTVGDHEGLMFGIGKAYRNEPGANLAYVGNDTMYRRGRSIAVGPTDERRVFGMDHASYQILDTPYRIQNNIANGNIAYANLMRYRMYRRLGLQVRVETAGRTLALLNQKLIVVRMRYGGQMETGGAVAIMSDAQT